jgi:hypothetical protein
VPPIGDLSVTRGYASHVRRRTCIIQHWVEQLARSHRYGVRGPSFPRDGLLRGVGVGDRWILGLGDKPAGEPEVVLSQSALFVFTDCSVDDYSVGR